MIKHPIRFFLCFTFGLSLAGAAGLWFALQRLDPLLCWLASVTFVTFLFYGYDKAVSSEDRTRVPEASLLALTLSGGTLGALAGMHLFRHKTVKKSFQLKFWLTVILQVATVFFYFFHLRGLIASW